MSTLSIADKAIPKALVVYNDAMGFGRFLEDSEIYPYTLHFTKEEFIQRFENPYNEARDEMKKDDETYNETSDFSESHYCSLEALFQYPTQFNDIFDYYLRNNLFEEFTNSKNFIYVINSLDGIQLSQDSVTITGRCFKKVERKC
jgi:hypothetical protein